MQKRNLGRLKKVIYMQEGWLPEKLPLIPELNNHGCKYKREWKLELSIKL